MYGIPFPPVSEREDRLEEAVQLIRMLFDADGKVDFEGKHYRLKDAVFVPKCVQSPHAPIMVAGGGEKRTLRTCARYGDVMNVFGTLGGGQAEDRGARARTAATPDAIRPRSSDRRPRRVIVSDNQGLIDRWRACSAPGMGLSAEEAKKVLPIGPAGARAGGRWSGTRRSGVTQVIMQTQGPWKREVYERINDEVVAAALVGFGTGGGLACEIVAGGLTTLLLLSRSKSSFPSEVRRDAHPLRSALTTRKRSQEVVGCHTPTNS